MKNSSYIFSAFRVFIIFVVSYLSVIWLYKTASKEHETNNSSYAINYLKDLLKQNIILTDSNYTQLKKYSGYDFKIYNDFNTLPKEFNKASLAKSKEQIKITNTKYFYAYYYDRSNQKLIILLSKPIEQVFFKLGYFKTFILLLFTFVLIVRLYTLWKLFKSQKKTDNYKKQLNKSEINFKNIANAIDDVFFIYDLQNEKYEFIGAKCENILGLDQDTMYKYPEEFGGKLNTDDLIVCRNAIQELKVTKKPYKIKFKLKVNDSIKHLTEHTYPILNPEGEVIKISGILSDITKEIEQKQKIELIQKHVELLTQVGYEINQCLTIEDVIKKIHFYLLKMMPADFFGIGLVEDHIINFPYFIEGDKVMSGSYSLNDNILSSICVNSKKEIYINEFKEIEKYSNTKLAKTKGELPESVIYIPLTKEDEVIGVITVQSKSKNAFTKTDKKFLENLVIYIVKAISKAELYESLEVKVKERTKELELTYKQQKLLSNIGIELSSSLKMNSVFDTLYSNLNKMVDASVFSIRLIDWGNQEVDYKFNIEDGVKIPSLRVPLTDNDNYTVWCVNNKETIVINDNEKEYSQFVKEIKVPFGKMPKSLIFVPLINNDRVIGVITVQSFRTNAYSDLDLNILKTLAFYTSVALSNAKLYENLEKKVIKRTKSLQETNQKILDSIKYTKHIQTSTLTAKSEIDLLLKNSFTFYKPKDILSGDFYRVDRINNDKTSIIVADCTGHGVPGATLAILCSNILKQGILESTVTKPNDLLCYVRNNLISYFKNSNEKVHDGMDVGAIVLNNKTLEIEFSGAFNDIYIVRNKELIILKGDRMHVGYVNELIKFTNHTFQLEPNDSIFLTTDGFNDQFGGEKYKKYSKKRMRNLFIQIAETSSENQLKSVRHEFENWKKEEEQTDDVCVFGFKV